MKRKFQMAHIFVFLSSDFYARHPISLYPEIEQKKNRPYIQVTTVIDGIKFAIPFRSNINHPHAFWTDKANRCGIDFSKAVVVESDDDIDQNLTPWIRQNEFDNLRGKEYRIQTGMRKYIKEYIKAKNNLNDKTNKLLCQKSTLQYYESYIEKIDTTV